MSNRHVTEATLESYQGPFFPSALKRVQKRFGYHPERMSIQLMDEVAIALPYGKVSHPRTNDGYRWFVGISFVYMGVRCKVLIPTGTDAKRLDGTFADRHVPLHAKEILDGDTFLERAGSLFAKEFVNVYKHLYGRSIKASKAAKGE